MQPSCHTRTREVACGGTRLVGEWALRRHAARRRPRHVRLQPQGRARATRSSTWSKGQRGKGWVREGVARTRT
jgi:hypothetical protein